MLDTRLSKLRPRNLQRFATMTWSRSRPASALAAATITGIVVYVAIDIVLAFLRPHFSIVHNAESDYGSAGHYAWLMDANFLLRAAFSLAAAGAISIATGANTRMRVGLSLLGVWAVCSGALAFFPDNPVGTPVHGSGHVHVVLAFVAFIAILLGTLEASLVVRHLPHWEPVRRTLVTISLAAFIPIVLLGHAHLRPHSLGGLYEKLFIALELLWLALAAAFAARTERDAGGGT